MIHITPIKCRHSSLGVPTMDRHIYWRTYDSSILQFRDSGGQKLIKIGSVLVGKLTLKDFIAAGHVNEAAELHS